MRPEESRDYIVGLYHQTWQNSNASIDALPLDTEAYVHWWKEGNRRPSFGSLTARVLAETAQHAGHAEILREGLDGQWGRDHDAFGDTAAWTAVRSWVPPVASIPALAARPMRVTERG